MITRQQIAQLMKLDTQDLPVVSFYLDVDGRQFSPLQYAEKTHQLVRQARESLQHSSWSKESQDSIRRDLDAIVRFVGAEFERGDRRGLAVFSCVANQFWQVYPLAVPVKDRIKVEAHCYVQPFATLIEDYPRYGVVLVDREKARLFVVHLGEIVEFKTVFDDVPGRVRVGTWYGLADDHIERHIEDRIHKHLKHTAEVLDHLATRENLDRILVGGSPDEVPPFLSSLPRKLAAMVGGEVRHLMMIASAEEVLARSQEAIAEIRRQEAAEIVRQVCETAGPAGYGVIGLEETLCALYDESLRVLVVERDLSKSGFSCSRCGRLFATSGPCPVCREPYARSVDNVVEEAVEAAFRQNAEMTFVSGVQEWTRLGGVGGLLRFHVPSVGSTKEAVPTAESAHIGEQEKRR